MKPSPRAKSAIDALGCLAAAGNGPISLAAVASRLDLSISYLEQIFAILRRAGVVISVRGPGGGYRLAGPADSIKLAAVVGLFDGATKGAGPHGEFWMALHGDVSDLLARRSLADVASGSAA